MYAFKLNIKALIAYFDEQCVAKVSQTTECARLNKTASTVNVGIDAKMSKRSVKVLQVWGLGQL